MALFTAAPMEADELSMCSMAAETLSMRTTAPSAARAGSFLATFLFVAGTWLWSRSFTSKNT